MRGARPDVEGWLVVRPARGITMVALALAALVAAGCSNGEVSERALVPTESPTPQGAMTTPMQRAVAVACGYDPAASFQRHDRSVTDAELDMITFERSDGEIAVAIHFYRKSEFEVPFPWHVTCSETSAPITWYSRADMQRMADGQPPRSPSDSPSPEPPPLPPPPPPVEPPPAPHNEPLTDVDNPDVACPADPGGPVAAEDAALCLYLAWTQDDRQLAGVYAEPAAVATMFDELGAWTGDGEWEFLGCYEYEGHPMICSWDAGVTVEMDMVGGASAGFAVAEVHLRG